jgi:SOS-response transcriptional repressor LexA
MKKSPRLEVKYVQYLGEVGCGRPVEAYDNVYPFIPKSELQAVALPENMPTRDVGIMIARGLSLSDFGIFDGDQLLVKTRCSWREVDDDTICVVYIHPTAEVVAKRVERGANKLLLKASGGGLPDKEYGIDEIELKGIVMKAIFDVNTLIARTREARIRQNGIGRRRRDELTPHLFADKKPDDIQY